MNTNFKNAERGTRNAEGKQETDNRAIADSREKGFQNRAILSNGGKSRPDSAPRVPRSALGILLFALCILTSRAATVTNQIHDAQGHGVYTNVTFTPKSTPQFPNGGAQVFSGVQRVMTDTNGNFSVSLAAGGYLYSVGSLAQDTVLISVPDTTNTYNIRSLVTNRVPFIYTFSPTYETLVNKGVANGYAPLGADGLVATNYLPPLGGGGSQTPILQDVDYDGFNLTNAGNLHAINAVWIGTNGLRVTDVNNNGEVFAIANDTGALSLAINLDNGDGFGFANTEEGFFIGDVVNAVFPLYINKADNNRVNLSDGLTAQHDIHGKVFAGDIFGATASDTWTVPEWPSSLYMIACDVDFLLDLAPGASNNVASQIPRGAIMTFINSGSGGGLTLTNSLYTTVAGNLESITLSNQWQAITLQEASSGTFVIIGSYNP